MRLLVQQEIEVEGNNRSRVPRRYESWTHYKQTGYSYPASPAHNKANTPTQPQETISEPDVREVLCHKCFGGRYYLEPSANGEGYVRRGCEPCGGFGFRFIVEP